LDEAGVVTHLKDFSHIIDIVIRSINLVEHSQTFAIIILLSEKAQEKLDFVIFDLEIIYSYFFV